MTEIPAEADIRCPAGKIFDVIIDFRARIARTLLAPKAYADTLPGL